MGRGLNVIQLYLHVTHTDTARGPLARVPRFFGCKMVVGPRSSGVTVIVVIHLWVIFARKVSDLAVR